MSFDVVMIKAFGSGSGNPVQENPAHKKYVSTSGKPLSEDSIAKAKELNASITKMGPFADVVSAECLTSYQTAEFATGNKVTVNKGFNQIRLGVFEGAEPPAIQKAYEEAHPTATFIPEPNDCLNAPWPNQPADAFETYPEVDRRVLDAFRNLSLDAKGDQVFVVSVRKEPARSVLLNSTLAESVRGSKFYKDLCVHLQREPTAEQPIRKFAVRGQLNPKDGSWMRFHCEDGKISLVEVSDSVEFRTAPPVPGYFK